MSWVLLVGAALNFVGAVRLAAGVWSARHQAPEGSDALQMKLFAAGTAAVFGSMYVLLYVEQERVVPFLVFGAALKTWAFVLSVVLYRADRVSGRQLAEFGVSNLAVAIGFWAYLGTLA